MNDTIRRFYCHGRILYRIGKFLRSVSVVHRTSLYSCKKQIAKFECELWYWDDEYEQFIKRKFYWGDFEATPCEWETVKYYAGSEYTYIKRPIWYRDVKCNLIDMGY